MGVHHLRVDRSHRGLHRRVAEAADKSDDHVADEGQRSERDCGHRGGGDGRREDEHGADGPDAHPAAGERPRDGLTDAGRAEHETRGAVGVEDVLDVQQIGEREHAAGKACGELRCDYSRDARSFQQADVALHKRTSLAPPSDAKTSGIWASDAPRSLWRSRTSYAHLWMTRPLHLVVGGVSDARYIVIRR